MEGEEVRRAKQGSRESSVHSVDPYGFERPADFDYTTYEEFFSRYLVVLTRRAIKWSKLLKGNTRVQKNIKVKRYIRKGIPNEHRAEVWMIVSGAQSHMDHNPDINRTFPDNIKFRKTAVPCLQKTLYNVLVAYGHHNPSVGYCQGMNFIAGYLILITRNEEESFWLLDALIGRILPGLINSSCDPIPMSLRISKVNNPISLTSVSKKTTERNIKEEASEYAEE
ncbi:hypothetical protein E2320_004774 [Naja naja]|nr:hypothetical protein E2320_004774 [Naja naja]